MRCMPLRSRIIRIICNLYFFNDITERKVAEKEMKRAFEQINQNLEMLADLNYQIRNPLTIIIVLADELPDTNSKQTYGPIHQIDDLITKLDMGWIALDKVRRFLMKHYFKILPSDSDST